MHDEDAVGVMLSGGIDPSAIAGAAQSIGATRGREPVHAFTLAFPGRPCDENVYSRAVIEKWGLKATLLTWPRKRVAPLSDIPGSMLDVPPYPTSIVGDPLRDRRRIRWRPGVADRASAATISLPAIPPRHRSSFARAK